MQDKELHVGNRQVFVKYSSIERPCCTASCFMSLPFSLQAYHQVQSPVPLLVKEFPSLQQSISVTMMPSLLTGSTFEGLAKQKKLGLVIDGKHTSTSNTTENVGTRTLEKRLDTFFSDDLASSVQRGLVLHSLLKPTSLARLLLCG